MKLIVELERKDVKNLQLIEVQALHLCKGDVLFDLSKKRLHKIKYCEYRHNCQFNIEKGNKEILVEYEDGTTTDYFDHVSTVYILVDISEITNICNRPEPAWEKLE